jgi:predicted transcriptional regulator
MSASPKAKEWTAGLSASPLDEYIAGSIILRATFQEALAKVRGYIGIGEGILRRLSHNCSVPSDSENEPT